MRTLTECGYKIIYLKMYSLETGTGTGGPGLGPLAAALGPPGPTPPPRKGPALPGEGAWVKCENKIRMVSPFRSRQRVAIAGGSQCIGRGLAKAVSPGPVSPSASWE